MPDSKLLRQRKSTACLGDNGTPLLPLHHQSSTRQQQDPDTTASASPNSQQEQQEQQQRIRRHKPSWTRKKSTKTKTSRIKCVILTLSITLSMVFGLLRIIHLSLLYEDDSNSSLSSSSSFSSRTGHHRDNHTFAQKVRRQYKHLWSKWSTTTSAKTTIACQALYAPHRSIQARINDGYCDCWYGQDEPNTAACSHVLVTQRVFDCQDDPNQKDTSNNNKNNNKHHPNSVGGIRPRIRRDRQTNHNHRYTLDKKEDTLSTTTTSTTSTMILASRVGDGIVDCPNGRDEEELSITQ